ncbi:MAG: hypothetical protein GY906_28810 [bacterium]|nr:hypothetical protein [bacterium]
MKSSSIRSITLGVAVALGLTSPLFADGPTNDPDTKAKVSQIGRTLTRFTGSELEVWIDYGFAAKNKNEEWLILNVSFCGHVAKSVEIRRDSVSVRAPDGTPIPLPSAEEFIKAYPQLRSAYERATVAAQPLSCGGVGRRGLPLDFQPMPGTWISRSAVHVNNRSLATGLLLFEAVGGIEPGEWALVLEFDEGQLSIPFVLQ